MMFLCLTAVLSLQDDEAKAQADRILEKMWTCVRPALERLNVPNLDKVKTSYAGSAAEFLKRLAALPKEKREALESSENPVAGIEILKVNEGLESDSQLWPPYIRDYVTAFAPLKLKEGAGEELLNRLQGSWKSEWKAARSTTTWNVGADGSVECEHHRSDKAEKETLKISFSHEYRMTVLRGSTRQDHTFFLHGDTFYLSGNLLYDVHPLPDRSAFAFKSEREYVLVENGSCTVIGETGLSTKGELTFSKKGDDELCTLKFQLPGSKWPGNRTYFVVGNHLVHQSLATVGTFRRP